MGVGAATTGLPHIERIAIFSEDRKYRHLLERWWDRSGGRFVTFVLLNPSKAGAEFDDHVVRTLMAFARSWGYHGMKVVNVYDFIATDPRVLLKAVKARKAVSGLCDRYIVDAIVDADRVVAGWGNHADELRADRVRQLISEKLVPLWVFGFNRAGAPMHPARLAHSTGLRIWRALA